MQLCWIGEPLCVLTIYDCSVSISWIGYYRIALYIRALYLFLGVEQLQSLVQTKFFGKCGP